MSSTTDDNERAATRRIARGEPLLEARGIVKRYGSVEALRGADFIVNAGEVVGLIGDNGAGKSTLVKILSGAVAPDEGQILFGGKPVEIHGSHQAHDIGIETVYQDLALAPDLDPAANLFLGREALRPGLLGALGFLDKGAMQRRATEVFTDLNVRIPSATTPVGNLSGGQRQGVSVGRAVTWASRVIFMDEPTAALGVVQSANVLQLIRRVRERGIAVVLISHSMPDVLDVCDRVEVLRLGERVAQFHVDGSTVEQLVGAMTGADMKGN